MTGAWDRDGGVITIAVTLIIQKATIIHLHNKCIEVLALFNCLPLQ